MRVLEGLGIAVVAGLTAWTTRHNHFVWDDRAAVLGNADVHRHDLGSLRELFAHDFWGTPIAAPTSHKSYRPLTVLTFRWNHYWHGLAPQGYHLANVALHGLCAGLVTHLARVLLFSAPVLTTGADVPGAPQTAADVGARVAGLLFAVHPVHCDAVASVVGRADLLCTLFAVLGVLCYERAVRWQREGRSWASWGAVIAALGLAIIASLCKELGFTVLGVYVVLEVLELWRMRSQDTQYRQQRHHHVGLLVGFTLCLAWARVRINGAQFTAVFGKLANHVALDDRRLVRIMTYAHIHAWYLWKLVWPCWLLYDYGFNTIPLVVHVTDPRNLLTVIAYFTVLMGLAHGLRHANDSPVLICIALGAIPFIPASNIFFPVGTIVAERLLYLPSVGFCVLVGHILGSAFVLATTKSHRNFLLARGAVMPLLLRASGLKHSITLLTSVILVASGWKAHFRNGEWRTEKSLFSAALKIAPENIKVLNNLVKTELNDNPLHAIAMSRVSLGLHPAQIEGNTNYGLALEATSDKLLAIRHLMKSYDLATTEFPGAGYVGSHLYYEWLGENKPHSLRAEATMYSPTVKIAKRALEESFRRGSRYPAHFYTRGLIAFREGDHVVAERYVKFAMELNEAISKQELDNELLVNHGALINMLAVLTRIGGNEQKALRLLEQGMEKYPLEVDLHINAAMIHFHRNELESAASILQRAIDIGSDADSLTRGGKLLEDRGQLNAALAFYRKVEKLASPGANSIAESINRVMTAIKNKQ